MVYLVRAVGLGKCKIGKADDPLQRIRCLQTNSPARLELVATLPGDVAQEKAIHSLFQRFRVIGEWFRDAPEIEAFFHERAGILIEVEPDQVDESSTDESSTATDYLHIRVTPSEKVRWVKSAGRDGRTMSNWVRRQLNVAAEDGDDLSLLSTATSAQPKTGDTPNAEARAQQELPLPG